MAHEATRGPAFAQSVVLGIMMCLGAIAAATLRPRLHLADLNPRISLVAEVPREFAGWKEDATVVPVLPNPEVQAALDSLYSSALARTYADASGQRVMVSIAYGSDQSSEATAVHRPEFCYSAHGYRVTSLREDTVDVAGRRLTVQRLVAVLGGRREPITYWITIDGTATLPGVGRKVMQVLYGLKGQIPDGLLFRVSSIGTSEAESFGLQDRFLRDIAGAMDPSVRQRYFGT